MHKKYILQLLTSQSVIKVITSDVKQMPIGGRQAGSVIEEISAPSAFLFVSSLVLLQGRENILPFFFPPNIASV